jgi:aspartyl-tRNA synthetase
MLFPQRTSTCGALTLAQADQPVILNGWVHRIRHQGGVAFITLRDRYGTTQVVVDERSPAGLLDQAAGFKNEYCLAVKGTVKARPESMRNAKMATGDIEVVASEFQVLSTAPALPFQIDDGNAANENIRLQYRYLDLRQAAIRDRILIRDKVTWAARQYLHEQGFPEIETPTLIKSTPEGARDFLVPSRVNQGKFYALPQSPQLYKQLLMVSGMDKYFQIARCYRDEDARGDRQPEFTQIDIEMSFVTAEDVYKLIEGMMKKIFKDAIGYELKTPFQRIPYDESMELYGSDKPDLRFGMPMRNFSVFVPGSGFGAFESVLEAGGIVKALVVKGAAEYASRKKIGEWEEAAKVYGAKGLAYMKVITGEGGKPALDTGVAKFFAPSTEGILRELEAAVGDVILLVADQPKIANTSLGAVRLKAGRELGLATPGEFAFAWIVDFPLFEFNDETQAWEPAHHMFTMPQARFIDTFDTDPGPVKGDLYDLVCNGLEMASGSIRIHDPVIQQRLFNVVGFPPEKAQERFGFLLDAFQYGPPPHGGIAPGLDRLVMVITQQESIREVIAFPKNTLGASPMDDSPAAVDENQLRDLGIALNLKK